MESRETVVDCRLMIGIDGIELNAASTHLLQHPAVCGVVLFARNIESANQLTQLCQQIKGLRDGGLLIAVDQEGGRVQRVRDDVTLLPPLGAIGEVYERDTQRGREAAFAHAVVMAQDIMALGMDLSFAPVADLNKKSEVIGDRAFHRGPQIVTTLLECYLAGMRAAGMAGTVKHFPGHGSVAADTHHLSAHDSRSSTLIEQTDMQPFLAAIAAGCEAVMASHVTYPVCDAQPASFSAYWLTQVLRQQLGFEGVIVTDDVCMAAAEPMGDLLTRYRSARAAGCDLLLACEPTAAEILLAGVDSAPRSKPTWWSALSGQPNRLDPQKLTACRQLVEQIPC